MRKAKILGLHWREIRNGQIYFGGDRTKNGKPRQIPVSDTMANELKCMKATQGGKRVVLLANLVFMTPRQRKGRIHGILRILESGKVWSEVGRKNGGGGKNGLFYRNEFHWVCWSIVE